MISSARWALSDVASQLCRLPFCDSIKSSNTLNRTERCVVLCAT